MAETHSEQKLKNSAVGSWAGYIYQGLCALYHCIKLLKDDDNNKELLLSLDAFEDFAILNQSKIIMSLHQCKDIKNKTDYEKDYNLMIDKCNGYIKDKEATPECKMYFHSNEQVTPTNPIIAYKYGEKNTVGLKPGDVFSQLEYITKAYLNEKEIPSDFSIIIAKCLRIIDEKILSIQQEYFNPSNNALLRDIARKHFISLSSLFDILQSKKIELSIHEEDITSWIKTRCIAYMLNNIEASIRLDKPNNSEKIEEFFENLNKLNFKQILQFIQRLNPNVNLTSISLSTYVETGSKQAIDALWRVIKETMSLSGNLDWQINGFNFTPSTLSPVKEVEYHCYDIYMNRANLDVLREYHWIVGNINESVPDIRKASGLITETPDDETSIEDYNIFNETKVGLLTLNDFNNGRYS